MKRKRKTIHILFSLIILYICEKEKEKSKLVLIFKYFDLENIRRRVEENLLIKIAVAVNSEKNITVWETKELGAVKNNPPVEVAPPNLHIKEAA